MNKEEFLSMLKNAEYNEENDTYIIKPMKPKIKRNNWSLPEYRVSCDVNSSDVTCIYARVFKHKNMYDEHKIQKTNMTHLGNFIIGKLHTTDDVKRMLYEILQDFKELSNDEKIKDTYLKSIIEKRGGFNSD